MALKKLFLSFFAYQIVFCTGFRNLVRKTTELEKVIQSYKSLNFGRTNELLRGKQAVGLNARDRTMLFLNHVKQHKTKEPVQYLYSFVSPNDNECISLSVHDKQRIDTNGLYKQQRAVLEQACDFYRSGQFKEEVINKEIKVVQENGTIGFKIAELLDKLPEYISQKRMQPTHLEIMRQQELFLSGNMAQEECYKYGMDLLIFLSSPKRVYYNELFLINNRLSTLIFKDGKNPIALLEKQIYVKSDLPDKEVGTRYLNLELDTNCKPHWPCYLEVITTFVCDLWVTYFDAVLRH